VAEDILTKKMVEEFCEISVPISSVLSTGYCQDFLTQVEIESVRSWEDLISILLSESKTPVGHYGRLLEIVHHAQLDECIEVVNRYTDLRNTFSGGNVKPHFQKGIMVLITK